jgi:hypothetical protein
MTTCDLSCPASSNRKRLFPVEASAITGSSAFADDDSREFFFALHEAGAAVAWRRLMRCDKFSLIKVLRS